MKKITNYFKSALLSGLNPTLSIKDTNFKIIKLEDIKMGILPFNITNSLLEDFVQSNNLKQMPSSIDIILSIKTLKTKFKDTRTSTNPVDDLSSIYYIPAVLTNKGFLNIPSNNKVPWFPREYLFPMIDAELSIGNIEDYDTFFKDNLARKYNLQSFKDYFEFCSDLYSYVTNTSIYDDFLLDKNMYEFDENIYVILDTTVNSIFHIKNLYLDILNQDLNTLNLYKNISSLTPIKGKKSRNNNIDFMIKHNAQMTSNFPLSPSQRESLHHFNELEDGEVLAISGPPGTGKTTLLQSVIANMFTTNAIKKLPPPIIVASSTNNQAVTNIIDSFKLSDNINSSNLFKRWITGVSSFATYFPSSKKINEAIKKDYQIMDSNKSFLNKLDDEKNITSSIDFMLSECSLYFKKFLTTVSMCKLEIHNQLILINTIKNDISTFANLINTIIKEDTIVDYTSKLESNLNDLLDQVNSKKDYMEHISIKKDYYEKRLDRWNDFFHNLPIIFKLFRKNKFVKKRSSELISTFILSDEVNFIEETFSLNDITNIYKNKIYNVMDDYNKANEEYLKIIVELNQLKDSKKSIDNSISKLKSLFDSFEDFGINLNNLIDLNNSHNLSDLVTCSDFNKNPINFVDTILDITLRPIEFWLSVHYYECTWIECEKLSDSQKSTNCFNVTKNLFYELSLVTPCLVVTFFMLPKLFNVYNSNIKKSTYLYNFIDLLIVDEAGQTSPEIALASFALAKKALVVGDEYQIPPVWSVSNALDIALAISSRNN